MPIFLNLFGWSFFAVSFDLLNEPFHVYVAQGAKLCKFWVFKDGSIELSKNMGFKPTELRKIETILKKNVTFVLEKYEEYCNENRISINYKTKHKP